MRCSPALVGMTPGRALATRSAYKNKNKMQAAGQAGARGLGGLLGDSHVPGTPGRGGGGGLEEACLLLTYASPLERRRWQSAICTPLSEEEGGGEAGGHGSRGGERGEVPTWLEEGAGQVGGDLGWSVVTRGEEGGEDSGRGYGDKSESSGSRGAEVRGVHVSDGEVEMRTTERRRNRTLQSRGAQV